MSISGFVLLITYVFPMLVILTIATFCYLGQNVAKKVGVHTNGILCILIFLSFVPLINAIVMFAVVFSIVEDWFEEPLHKGGTNANNE